jgi:hypothetical protein
LCLLCDVSYVPGIFTWSKQFPASHLQLHSTTHSLCQFSQTLMAADLAIVAHDFLRRKRERLQGCTSPCFLKLWNGFCQKKLVGLASCSFGLQTHFLFS